MRHTRHSQRCSYRRFRKAGELESLSEIIRDRHALLERFRLRVANVVLHIGFHLPFVGGMRLANVNGQEIRTLFVVPQ